MRSAFDAQDGHKGPASPEDRRPKTAAHTASARALADTEHLDRVKFPSSKSEANLKWVHVGFWSIRLVYKYRLLTEIDKRISEFLLFEENVFWKAC